MIDAAHEVRAVFADKGAWDAFAAANPWVRDPRFIASIAEYAKRRGVRCAAVGFTPPEAVDVVPPNYRETIVARGLNARARTLLDELVAVATGPAVLALEAVTPFAQQVRELFPHALLTEYLPLAADRERLPDVRHCDILASGLPSGSFDAVVSGDVLEHVPDLDAALRETRRILRQGGVCLATFPFKAANASTEVRAILSESGVEHLMMPEYHGDPVRPDGALVYAIPGWDIIDKCRGAGFSDARMVFISSAARGVTATGLAGVFVLHAVA